MQWTTFDRAYCIGCLPYADQSTVADYFAAYPDMAAKADEIVANVIAQWRAAVRSGKGNELDDATDTLPRVALWHAAQQALYQINAVTELGFGSPSDLIRAEVYLRSISESGIPINADPDDDTADALTPSYDADLPAPDRPISETSPI